MTLTVKITVKEGPYSKALVESEAEITAASIKASTVSEVASIVAEDVAAALPKALTASEQDDLAKRTAAVISPDAEGGL